VEEEARNQQLNPEERLALRQEKSRPVWEELFAWMRIELEETLPKSPIGGAIAYALKRRKNLEHFLLDGRLEIDNNLVENAIRPIAVGRKNYLFAGSHEAAQRIAIVYTFVNACKQNRIAPYAWLLDVLPRIYRHPINRIEELLPQNWTPPDKPENQAD
jgi:hypothetical protein